jgi:hypothetical protein
LLIPQLRELAGDYGVDGAWIDGECWASVPVMAEVAKFCRARQAICHRAEMVPQVALLLSTAGHYRKINGLFSRDLSRVSGVLQALLESQQCVEFLGEHHLAGRMSQYPLIIVSEWEYLDPVFKDGLIAYVRAGGNLLLTGPGAAAMFGGELDVTLEGQPKSETHYLAHERSLMTTKGFVQLVKLGHKAQVFGQVHTSNNAGSASQPAASITPLGNGKIAAAYFSLGQGYAAARDEVARQSLNELAHRLFPDPIVQVEGSNDVDVSLAINHGKLLVHLVNTAGPHQTEPVVDAIPLVGPLTVTIRQSVRPSRITLEPVGELLPFEFQNGLVRLTVPHLEIHDIIVLYDGAVASSSTLPNEEQLTPYSQ